MAGLPLRRAGLRGMTIGATGDRQRLQRKADQQQQTQQAFASLHIPILVAWEPQGKETKAQI